MNVLLELVFPEPKAVNARAASCLFTLRVVFDCR